MTTLHAVKAHLKCEKANVNESQWRPERNKCIYRKERTSRQMTKRANKRSNSGWIKEAKIIFQIAGDVWNKRLEILFES